MIRSTLIRIRLTPTQGRASKRWKHQSTHIIPSRSNNINSTSTSSKRINNITAALGASLSCILFLYTTQCKTNNTESQSKNKNDDPLHFFETNLMDRIANKPYLQVSNYTASPNNSMQAANNDNSGHHSNRHSQSISSPPHQPNIRPKGVPPTLRILSIDLPEFRNVFDEECKTDFTKVYPDGIASPKKIRNPADKEMLEVVQKSLVQSYWKCGNGVEIMEASVKRLNPRDLKRGSSFARRWTRIHMEQQEEEEKEEDEEGDIEEKQRENNSVELDDDAPWHQTAWIEEMQLRISGKIDFSSPPTPSSTLSRLIFGNSYSTTIPPTKQYPTLFLPLTPLLSFFYPGRTTPCNEIDDGFHTRASHKPHAIIANAYTMQSVPGSLLHLTKTARAHDIPLYIINDQRAWGRNSHVDLRQASLDMKKTVKRNVIQNAMKWQLGTRFERGRSLGRFEMKVAYYLGEVRKGTIRVFSHVALSGIEANTNGEDDEDDWGGWSKDRLRQELKKRKIFIVGQDGKEECSKDMMELCVEILGKEVDHVERSSEVNKKGQVCNDGDVNDAGEKVSK